MDDGIAEDSFRLLWSGLDDRFRFLRFAWSAGERPRTPRPNRESRLIGGTEGIEGPHE